MTIYKTFQVPLGNILNTRGWESLLLNILNNQINRRLEFFILTAREKKNIFSIKA